MQEDFSYFLAEKPGCMVFVGSRPPGGELFPHHHPSFDIDEKALLVVCTLTCTCTCTIDMYCTTLLAKYHTTLPSLFGPL